MKKIMAFILGIIMTFGLVACGSEENVDTTDTLATSSETESITQADLTAEYEVEAPGEGPASASQVISVVSDGELQSGITAN